MKDHQDEDIYNIHYSLQGYNIGTRYGIFNLINFLLLYKLHYIDQGKI